MSIAAWIIAFAATLVFGMGVGVKWEKGQDAIHHQEAQEAAQEKRRMLEKMIDTSAVKHEREKEKIRTEFVVITERVEDAKHSDFYAAGAPACLDDVGVRIINDAARGAAQPASQPASAVPGSSPTHKWWPFGRARPDA